MFRTLDASSLQVPACAVRSPAHLANEISCVLPTRPRQRPRPPESQVTPEPLAPILQNHESECGAARSGFAIGLRHNDLVSMGHRRKVLDRERIDVSNPDYRAGLMNIPPRPFLCRA
jgi:hypothetical protein